MTFEIEINGTTRAVTIEPVDPAAGDGAFRIVLDGEVHEDSVTATDVGLALRFAGGRVVDAALTERGRDEWLVQLPRVALTAVVDGRRHTHGATPGVSIEGEQPVVAPMPGRVLRVLVAPGDEVAERQGLVVVEAMKMENEIGAPKAGRVKDVAVTEGMSIEAGRVLVVVE
jgi:biotin carboxyl carrier protein